MRLKIIKRNLEGIREIQMATSRTWTIETPYSRIILRTLTRGIHSRALLQKRYPPNKFWINNLQHQDSTKWQIFLNRTWGTPKAKKWTMNIKAIKVIRKFKSLRDLICRPRKRMMPQRNDHPPFSHCLTKKKKRGRAQLSSKEELKIRIQISSGNLRILRDRFFRLKLPSLFRML